MNSYIESFFNKNKKIKIVTARSGNVIGGGDYSKNRIIPDIINALNKNKEMIVRNPNHIRPWQHVIEPLFGYIELSLQIAECVENKDRTKLKLLLSSFNFGPNGGTSFKVIELINFIKKFVSLEKILIEKDKKNFIKETRVLKVSSKKAKYTLGWTPKFNTKIAIERTIKGYMNWIEGENAEKIISQDIDYYLSF